MPQTEELLEDWPSVIESRFHPCAMSPGGDRCDRPAAWELDYLCTGCSVGRAHVCSQCCRFAVRLTEGGRSIHHVKDGGAIHTIMFTTPL